MPASARSSPSRSVLKKWQARILSRQYDPRPLPWWEKTGVTLGMGMTERQGGTDVRANITEAAPHGDHVELSGHKWFMSAPMCDAFLVLAQAPAGLTCYLMPRYRPDGSQNAIRFQRLKDKLGNKSNASSEVEFHGAWAERVGPEGAGVRTIIEMVNLTRLDCAIASAGQMRFGLSQALSHIRNRSVFQKRLADQPAMRAVVADLALELEAQVALVFRLAHAVDKGRRQGRDRLCPPADARGQIPDLQDRRRRWSTNRSSAWAATATPRTCRWRGSIARRRSTRSGKARATSWRSTCCAPPAVIPRRRWKPLGALARTASKAFDVRPLAGALEKTLKSPDAERRARFLCEGLARLAALAALAEANSPFAALYGDARLNNAHFAQFGTADLGQAEQALMDRALAA